MTPSSSYLQAFHVGGTAPTMGVPPLELTAGLGQLLLGGDDDAVPLNTNIQVLWP